MKISRELSDPAAAASWRWSLKSLDTDAIKTSMHTALLFWLQLTQYYCTEHDFLQCNENIYVTKDWHFIVHW